MDPMEAIAKNWRELIRPRGITVDEANNQYGKFVAEPFERGFGITLHTRHCRQLTAAFVFGMAFVHVSAPAAVLLALLELTVCPTRLLWAPAPKRPSNTNAESKKKTSGKLKGIASNSAARYSSDAHGALTCEFVSEISDRVRPLDDGCPVRTHAQVRFLWAWNGRAGGQESQEVVARADHVFNRASVPLPDEWFPTLRFAELPQIANKSADAALRGCRRPSEDDTSLSKAFLAAVHCECVGVAKPFAEARCVSGYAAGMELWFDENGQRQMYMLVAELDGASCRSSSSCRIVLSQLSSHRHMTVRYRHRVWWHTSEATTGSAIVVVVIAVSICPSKLWWRETFRSRLQRRCQRSGLSAAGFVARWSSLETSEVEPNISKNSPHSGRGRQSSSVQHTNSETSTQTRVRRYSTLAPASCRMVRILV